MKEKEKSARGGYRQGAGRKKGKISLNNALSVRITDEALGMLNRMTKAKSAFIDRLIKAEWIRNNE